MNDFDNKKEWKLTKKVLPQHTDHAGVLWHGTYFNFLEEARIDALNRAGIPYSKLSREGIEIPLISAQIKYKISFLHGEDILLISQFKFVNKIRFKCRTLFLKSNSIIGAEAIIEVIFVRKQNDSIKILRQLPVAIKNSLLILEEGPKN